MIFKRLVYMSTNTLVLACSCMQFIIVQYLNKFAQTVKLNVKWWGLCVAIGFIR